MSELGAIRLDIITSKRKYEWLVDCLIPEREYVKSDEYENILRPVFGDKLFVKKWMEVWETPKSFLKKCIKCGKEIPIASEECQYCETRQP